MSYSLFFVVGHVHASSNVTNITCTNKMHINIWQVCTPVSHEGCRWEITRWPLINQPFNPSQTVINQISISGWAFACLFSLSGFEIRLRKSFLTKCVIGFTTMSPIYANLCMCVPVCVYRTDKNENDEFVEWALWKGDIYLECVAGTLMEKSLSEKSCLRIKTKGRFSVLSRWCSFDA